MWELLNGKRLSMHNRVFRYYGDSFDKYRVDKLDMSGNNHPMYGKRHSVSSVNKMKENRKGKGSGSRNYNSQKVMCDEIIFSCIRECQEYLGISYTTLVCWLRGRNPMPDEYVKRGLSVI